MRQATLIFFVMITSIVLLDNCHFGKSSNEDDGFDDDSTVQVYVPPPILNTPHSDSIRDEFIREMGIDDRIIDSLKHLSDSLRTKLLLSNFKIQKVKYYVKIVDGDKTQLVNLKGWIKRAIK